MIVLRSVIILISLMASLAIASAEGISPDFVHLRDVDPSIVQDIRYAGSDNFTGAPAPGYDAASCMLTTRAAQALSTVQKALAGRNLSIIVWDCYRPARATAYFLSWAANGDQSGKSEFFPNVDKRDLFRSGYISRRSAHSRGSTIDLGIVALGAAPARATPIACASRPRADLLDFGTGYDCLDPASGVFDARVGVEARHNRLLLTNSMKKAGFVGYSKEWWHFTLVSEPYPKRMFDFPVTAGGER